MNLHKAIENLKAGREDAGMIPEDEYTPTLDLAREALERVQNIQDNPHSPYYAPLPNETKD